MTTRSLGCALALLLAACGGAGAEPDPGRPVDELAALAAEVTDPPPSSIDRYHERAEREAAEREAARNAELRTPPAEIVECGSDECEACRAELDAAGIPVIEARCAPRACEVDADCATLADGSVCADPGGEEPTGDRLCRMPRRGLDYSCDPAAPGVGECETGLRCAGDVAPRCVPVAP